MNDVAKKIGLREVLSCSYKLILETASLASSGCTPFQSTDQTDRRKPPKSAETAPTGVVTSGEFPLYRAKLPRPPSLRGGEAFNCPVSVSPPRPDSLPAYP